MHSDMPASEFVRELVAGAALLAGWLTVIYLILV